MGLYRCDNIKHNDNKKNIQNVLLILICICVASLYGIVHDQLTYSISPEYYTKFKFYQFGIVNDPNSFIANPRQLAILVGIMATWWIGMIIGLVIGLICLAVAPSQIIIKTALKAILLIILITFLTGLLGLAYGYIVMKDLPKENFENWYLPKNIGNLSSFIMVGSMHNFSYAGGLIGLIAAIVYIVKNKRKALHIL